MSLAQNTKNALQQLRMCKTALGCKSSDPYYVRKFVYGKDEFLRKAGAGDFLRCLVAILTSDDHDIIQELHLGELVDVVITKIRGIDRKDHLLELSLVALNFALRHNLVPTEVFDGLFQSLLAVVRDFVKSSKDAPLDDNEAVSLQLTLVTALKIATSLRVPFTNKNNPVVVVKELIQFHCNSSLPVARVNEEILRLALCLITKELELAIDPFLASWSLKTLSQAPDSILYLQLALGYLEKVFLPIKVGRTNRQAQQESEQRAKLASKILATGCIRNLLWMLLHPDNDISNLSCKVLKRILGPRAKSKSQQNSNQITYLDIDKPSVLRQLLKQSLVPILFGAKQALKNEIDPDDRIHLLEQITTRIRQTVNRLLNKGSPADAIKELVGNENSQDSIQSCTGLLLIQCTETFERDVVKMLIEKVLSTITQQSNFIESGEIFWHAIESVIDSGFVAFRDTETNAPTMQSLSDGTIEPIQIIFRSTVDGSETPMELPSLVTLRNTIPKLAMQVRSVAIEQQ